MNGRGQFSIANERKKEDSVFSKLCLVNFIMEYNIHTDTYATYMGQWIFT